MLTEHLSFVQIVQDEVIILLLQLFWETTCAARILHVEKNSALALEHYVDAVVQLVLHQDLVALRVFFLNEERVRFFEHFLCVCRPQTGYESGEEFEFFCSTRELGFREDLLELGSIDLNDFGEVGFRCDKIMACFIWSISKPEELTFFNDFRVFVHSAFEHRHVQLAAEEEVEIGR